MLGFSSTIDELALKQCYKSHGSVYELGLLSHPQKDCLVEQDAAPNHSPRLSSASVCGNSTLTQTLHVHRRVRGWCALRYARLGFEKTLHVEELNQSSPTS